ncbi:MAG TPA: ABC-F family ATP-binding cassette domain-containing protein [Actinomycetales bacterium]|nr:ABC-F family ATP-binding cassette domain-containing protein [Actinomycetales bacterium]
MATTNTTAVQLRLLDVTRRFGDRTVFDGLDLTVSAGERVGLVGENGSGKSTLLRLAAAADIPDAGTVRVHGSVGHLPQRVTLPPHATVSELLVQALAELDAIQIEMRRLERHMAEPDGELDELLTRYGELTDEFERREGWTAHTRLDAAVERLGVGHLDRNRRLGELSGGQRSRLAIAVLLGRRPDVLLLDEPTTHLDDDANDFLEGELRRWSGAVLVASHDRAFLDAVCTSIVDMDPTRAQGLSRYGGAYTDYLTAKADERARWERAYEEWREEHNRLTALTRPAQHRVGHDNRAARDNDKYAPHFFGQRVEASVARRVRDAEQRLARLEQVPKPPVPLCFSGDLAETTRRDGVLISVRDLVVNGRVAVRALDIAHDTMLLVTGPNGAGKSSLLHVLAGVLGPDAGAVHRARGVRVGLLAQETRWSDPSATVVSAFAGGRDADLDEQVKALLDVGLLHPRDLHRPVGDLSVGQQRRVALARVVVEAPDVLLLDEPTDHLSLALVEELEEALRRRGGPLVVVSHDRWLRGRWRQWEGQVADVRSL